MATLAQVAQEIYPCKTHGIPGTFHEEDRHNTAIHGAFGVYEPDEWWTVDICDECGQEVKPEPDYSQVMEMPF